MEHTVAKKIIVAMGSVLSRPGGNPIQTPGLLIDGVLFPHHITEEGPTVVNKYGEYYEVTITILADDVEFTPFGVEIYAQEAQNDNEGP